jgi:hypothetical protein
MLFTLSQRSIHRGVAPLTLPTCGPAMIRYMPDCLMMMSPLSKSIVWTFPPASDCASNRTSTGFKVVIL